MELKAPAADFRFSTAFAISVWVNPTTLPTGWHVITARQIGADTTDVWFLGHNGPTVYFNAGGVVTTTIAAGQWTHLAAVKDGNTVALYKNGVLAASITTATNPLATDANEVSDRRREQWQPAVGRVLQRTAGRPAVLLGGTEPAADSGRHEQFSGIRF